MADEPLSDFPGPLYQRCEDPDCKYAHGADPPRVHYHFKGKGDG